MKTGTRVTAGFVAAAAIIVSGCSIANTNGAEVALHYEGGWLAEGKGYEFCVSTNTYETGGVHDDNLYYPAGQRDFNFNNTESADSAALTSTTKDAQEASVTGTVKFTLNADCTPFTDPTGKEWPGGKIQYFHELIGLKYQAFNTEGGQPTNQGWNDLLTNYIGAALDRATDNEALKYDLLALYSNADTKAAWERDVLAQLPKVLKQLTQGVDLFTINAVVLQKPGIQPKIRDGLTEKNAAVLRAEAVEVDKQAAANFPGGIDAYQRYQQQQAVNEAIKSGKVQVLPVPQGSPVIVAPTPR
jgi:hypothetical protein